MADTEKVGKDFLFYINAGSEPSTPDEITNYTKVGLITSFEFSLSADRIPVVHKDTGNFRETLGGSQGYTINLSGVVPTDGNAGHTIVHDAAKATADASKLVYWLNTSDVTNDYQKRGSGRVLDYTESHPTDDVITWTAVIEGNGDYTHELVDA